MRARLIGRGLRVSVVRLCAAAGYRAIADIDHPERAREFVEPRIASHVLLDALNYGDARPARFADYLVTPTECAGFGTEKSSLAAGGLPKSRSQVRSVAPADANP